MTDQKLPPQAPSTSVPPQQPPKLPPAPKPLQPNQPQSVQPGSSPALPPKPAAPAANAVPPLPRPTAVTPTPAAAAPSTVPATKPLAAAPPQPKAPVAASVPAPTPAKPPAPAPVPRPAGVAPVKAPLPVTPPVSTLSDRPPTSTIAQRPAGLPATPPPNPVASATLPKPPTPAGAAPGSKLPPAPAPAEFKKSPLRFLPIIVAVLLMLGLGYFIYNRFFSGAATPSTNTPGTNTPATGTKQTVITYWGLWEPTTVLQDTLADFEKANPGIKVNYKQQTYQDYRERLQTDIASGKGPDVFRFHASWTPMLRAELAEVPSSVYSAAEFKATFYPVAEQQLKINNKYVGVPLMYDGLALFYNEEYLRTANAEVPETWNELKALASRLTLREGSRIQRAGLAIGNASNVDHFGEILGLLILQNGASPAAPTSPKAIEAIQYYTDFYTKDRVWDDQMANSTVAFARGDVAMMLAPSWRAHEIAAQNPNLTFAVAPVPQFSSEKVTWASYWAEGVSAQSKNKDAAWKLIQYLSSEEALQKLHSDASKERGFGEIYPRVDMAPSLAEQKQVAPFLADAPFAQSWYLNTFTHDNGLNDQILKYYEDMLTAITTDKGTPTSSATTVDQGVKQVLRQYNLTN